MIGEKIIISHQGQSYFLMKIITIIIVMLKDFMRKQKKIKHIKITLYLMEKYLTHYLEIIL